LGNLRVVAAIAAVGVALAWVKGREAGTYDIPEASVNGFIPFLNGMARSNPEPQQVATEYERTTRGR